MKGQAMYKNILCQYSGGGYDGFIWEWNYFIFNKAGEFQNIFASGIDGIEDTVNAIKMIEKIEQERDRKIYDLTKEESIKEFVTTVAYPHVFGVIKWLFLNTDYEAFVICSLCNEKVYGDEIELCSLEEWHGCGGIGLTAEALICNDCHSLYSCSYCGEYYGKDEKSGLISTREQIVVEMDLPEKVLDTLADELPLCYNCLQEQAVKEIDYLIERSKQ
jgi:hypothetical protein